MATSSTSLLDLPPHLLYRILMQGSLSALDLAHLETTCFAFRAVPGLLPLRFKSLVEMAAVELCKGHPLYCLLPPLHRAQLLRRCGHSWKMLLRYLQATQQANGLVLTPKGKVQVVAGQYNSWILTCDKGLFVCGSGSPFVSPNQIVLPETYGLLAPMSLPQNVVVTQVASCHQHVALITSGGQLYTYGDNKSGCCGVEETNQSSFDTEEANQNITEPTLVTTLKGLRCKQVSAGVKFTMVLTAEGHVYSCGKNTHGQLGHGNRSNQRVFTKIEMFDGEVVQISAGSAHALAVTEHGDAFSWGYGGKACLGHQELVNEIRPRLIQSFKDIFLMSVSAGYEHSAALDSNGQVYTWGRGHYGALGHGHEFDVKIPQRVATLSEIRAVQVSTRKRRTFVLSDDGRLYGFGWMGFGRSGLFNKQSSEKVIVPSVLDSLQEHHISQVSAGPSHTLVATNKGIIYGFGDNEMGPLGMNQLGICREPIEVVNVEHLKASTPFEQVCDAVTSLRL